MDLLFIWIEDFRNIKKCGFDFSAELHFDVLQDSSSGENKHILEVNLNEGYVNLFDKNIVSVTGIVGKNGSGKSSLLHCIKLMTGQLEKLTSPLIFCLLDRESGTVKTYYYEGGGTEDMKPLSLTVKAGTNMKNRFKLAKPRPYRVKRMLVEGSKIDGLDFDFGDVACCYFSNTFDSHRENIYEKIFNISTNYRVEAFLKKYIEKREKGLEKRKNETPKIEIWPSHIFEYHKSELRTLLKFLSYANTRKTGNIPDLPRSINIEFNLADYQFLVEEAPSSFLYNITEIKTIQAVALEEINKTKDPRENFINIVLLCTFYYLLRLQLSNKNNFDLDNLRTGITDLTKETGFFFKRMRLLLEDLTSGLETENIKTIREFLGENFIRSVQKIQFSDLELVSDNKSYYRLKIDNNLWTVLSLIYDLRALDESTFIDYSWGTGLSTGEEAFLHHFARLNELKNKLQRKEIWLLVDEGDLYFHPQWQKEYFSHLIEYIKFLFPQNRVQIIISTHSPFIASDLPKQNLIFLKKDLDGNCKVANQELHKETFGSNIHELFTDSFFLSDGLMGEFARNKIEDLIKEINKIETISDEAYENNFRNRIEIIGEPFIRTKLFEMVANKSSVSVIDQIIQQRNKEINILEQIRISKQDDQNRKS